MINFGMNCCNVDILPKSLLDLETTTDNIYIFLNACLTDPVIYGPELLAALWLIS